MAALDTDEPVASSNPAPCHDALMTEFRRQDLRNNNNNCCAGTPAPEKPSSIDPLESQESLSDLKNGRLEEPSLSEMQPRVGVAKHSENSVSSLESSLEAARKLATPQVDTDLRSMGSSPASEPRLNLSNASSLESLDLNHQPYVADGTQSHDSAADSQSDCESDDCLGSSTSCSSGSFLDVSTVGKHDRSDRASADTKCHGASLLEKSLSSRVAAAEESPCSDVTSGTGTMASRSSTLSNDPSDPTTGFPSPPPPAVPSTTPVVSPYTPTRPDGSQRAPRPNPFTKKSIDEEMGHLDTAMPSLDFDKLEKSLARAAKEREANLRRVSFLLVDFFRSYSA